jgi:hypothetical protein
MGQAQSQYDTPLIVTSPNSTVHSSRLQESSPAKDISATDISAIPGQTRAGNFFGNSLSVAFGTPPVNRNRINDPTNLSASNTNIHNVSLNPIDAFLKSMRFCNTIVLFASSKHGNRGDSDVRRETTRANSSNDSAAGEIIYAGSPNPITPRFRRMYMSPYSKQQAEEQSYFDLRYQFLQVFQGSSYKYFPFRILNYENFPSRFI